jgi:hypothetical protein
MARRVMACSAQHWRAALSMLITSCCVTGPHLSLANTNTLHDFGPGVLLHTCASHMSAIHSTCGNILMMLLLPMACSDPDMVEAAFQPDPSRRTLQGWSDPEGDVLPSSFTDKDALER